MNNRGFKIEREVPNVDGDIEERLNSMTDHLSGEDIDVHLKRARSADDIINAQLDLESADEKNNSKSDQ